MPRTHRPGQAPRKCVVALVLEHWKKGQESIILLLSLPPKNGNQNGIKMTAREPKDLRELLKNTYLSDAGVFQHNPPG